MIQLTRLNNQPLIVNSDLIKLIENTPDTLLTLVTGEKIVVLESSKQVVDKIVDFRRRVLTDLSVQDVSSSSQTARMTRQLFPVEKS